MTDKKVNHKMWGKGKRRRVQIHNAVNARAVGGRLIEEKHLATPLRYFSLTIILINQEREQTNLSIGSEYSILDEIPTTAKCSFHNMKLCLLYNKLTTKQTLNFSKNNALPAYYKKFWNIGKSMPQYFKQNNL